MGMFGFSGGGAFNKSSQSTTNATTKHTASNFSEVDNASSLNLDASGNGTKTFNITDGGAVNSAFSFANDLVRDANALNSMVLDTAFKSNAETTASALGAALQAAQPEPMDTRVLILAGLALAGMFYVMRGH